MEFIDVEKFELPAEFRYNEKFFKYFEDKTGLLFENEDIFKYHWRCFADCLDIEGIRVESYGNYFSDTNIMECLDEMYYGDFEECFYMCDGENIEAVSSVEDNFYSDANETGYSDEWGNYVDKTEYFDEEESYDSPRFRIKPGLLIKATTGKGKTYFIINTLREYNENSSELKE